MYKKILRLLPAMSMIIAGIVFLCTGTKKNPETVIVGSSEPDFQAEQISQEEDSGIWVYISGHVNHPGVYNVSGNCRLFEAIETAGGLSHDSAGDTLNLAGKLVDGQHIYVPGIDDLPEVFTHDAHIADGGLINLNSASLETLETLPGIGESKARAIIDYREKSPFVCIEDIMNVPGIKENSFNKIKDKIIV